MRRNTSEEAIEIIQAWISGKKIQCVMIEGGGDTWSNIDCPCWNFERLRYRIKPEPRKPRVIWVNEYEGGPKFGFAFESPNEANEKGTMRNKIATRKFIEVIEDDQP